MAKSLRYNYILNLIKTVSGMLFPLITFAYASRILSVDGIGKIDFVKNIVALFIIIASLGISTYGTREGAKVRNSKNNLSKLVKELLTINLIATIVSYVVFVVMVLFVPKFSQFKDIFFIYGLCIGFTAIGLDWLYNALEDFEYITIRYVLFQIISLVLMFVFVKDKDDYLVYTGILTFSSVGSHILNLFHSRKFVDYTIKVKLSIQPHIKPIFILFSYAIIGNIYLSLDSAMLGWMESAYNVGLYAAANKMNRVVLTIITSLFVVILPRASYYVKNNEKEKLNDILNKSVNFIFMLSLPLALLVFILSKDIILLLSGSDFIPATLCSRILSLVIILIPLSTMTTSEVLIPMGHEKKMFICSFVGAIINAILNFVLIPLLKENGAAIASVISELCVAILTTYFASKCIRIIPAMKNIWHYAIATAAIAIILIPLSKIIGEGIVRCFTFGAISVAVYILVLFLLRDQLVIQLSRNVITAMNNVSKKFHRNTK